MWQVPKQYGDKWSLIIKMGTYEVVNFYKWVNDKLSLKRNGFFLFFLRSGILIVFDHVNNISL